MFGFPLSFGMTTIIELRNSLKRVEKTTAVPQGQKTKSQTKLPLPTHILPKKLPHKSKQKQAKNRFYKNLRPTASKKNPTRTPPNHKAKNIPKKTIGYFSLHEQGFGFVDIFELGGVFIAPEEAGNLVQGDKLAIKITSDSSGRLNGSILEIVERQHRQAMGILFKQNGNYFVENKMLFSHKVRLFGKNLASLADKSLIKIGFSHQDHEQALEAQFIQSLGRLDDYSALEQLLIQANVPYVFAEQVLQQAEQRATKWKQEKPGKYRHELTKLPFVTIDGEDAKDFDDAIYCEKTPEGYRLFVAIADVTHFLEAQSPMDKEAQRRATSIYFPGRVVPMLPEALSNDICSLLPRRRRFALVMQASFDKSGERLESEFYLATIKSHARLTYNQVERAYQSDWHTAESWSQAILSSLKSLAGLTSALLEKRADRGSLDFFLPEFVVDVDAKRKVVSIHKRQQLFSQKMVEEAMIAANQAAAELLDAHYKYGVYRVHPEPGPAKLAKLKLLLDSISQSKNSLKNIQKSSYLQQKLQEIQEKNHEEIFAIYSLAILKCLEQALYSPKIQQHYGLKLEAYSHFTSPIRRYPDAMAHRLIKALLEKSKKPSYADAELFQLCQWCSTTERRADSLSKQFEDFYKLNCLSSLIGHEIGVRICHISASSIQVWLEDVGLVKTLYLQDVPQDFFQFFVKENYLLGKRTGLKLKLGMELSASISRVVPDKNILDLELILPYAKKLKGQAKTRSASGGFRGRKKHFRRS